MGSKKIVGRMRKKALTPANPRRDGDPRNRKFCQKKSDHGAAEKTGTEKEEERRKRRLESPVRGGRGDEKKKRPAFLKSRREGGVDPHRSWTAGDSRPAPSKPTSPQR